LNSSVHGATVHDSKIAREVIILVRDTELPSLFHHSRRIYCFSVLAGKRCGLSFDPELSTRAAMFHDTGSPISTAARASVSKSIAPTCPAPSCAAMASPTPISKPSGPAHWDRALTTITIGSPATCSQDEPGPTADAVRQYSSRRRRNGGANPGASDRKLRKGRFPIWRRRRGYAGSPGRWKAADSDRKIE
jgi:hypothetical protein